MARPMPEPAPVTAAMWFCSSMAVPSLRAPLAGEVAVLILGPARPDEIDRRRTAGMEHAALAVEAAAAKAQHARAGVVAVAARLVVDIGITAAAEQGEVEDQHRPAVEPAFIAPGRRARLRLRARGREADAGRGERGGGEHSA